MKNVVYLILWYAYVSCVFRRADEKWYILTHHWVKRCLVFNNDYKNHTKNTNFRGSFAIGQR